MSAAQRSEAGTLERVIQRRVKTSLDREVWLTRLAFVRLAWKELFGTAAAVASAGAVFLLVPFGPGAPRYVMAGVLFASAFWIPFSVICMRTYSVTVGSWAEGWTREVLQRRSLGWSVIDDLVLGPGNIDHVAVTQDDVLVVESKYRGMSRRSDQNRHDKDIEQTRKAAKRIRRDLHVRGLDVSSVVPLLVVWGPGGQHLPRLGTAADVHVVAGQDLKAWCDSRSTRQLVSLGDRTAIAEALAERRREHDTWRARVSGS